jgi:hypothetical protein
VRWSDGIVHPPSRPRGAKRAGLAYEQKVADVLAAIYSTAFTRSPVIRYRSGSRGFAAIPDGILRLGDEIFIIEVKLAHTERIWEQLIERYAPLVRILEPQRLVRTIEVCRSFDPAVVVPGPFMRINSLHRRPQTDGLEVLQWKL